MIGYDQREGTKNMLDIKLKQIESYGADLGKTVGQIAAEAMDLESVISSLAAIEGMGDFAGAVRKQLQKLDEERQDIYRLCQGLSKITAQYNKGEEDIINECDGCRITYSQRETETVTVLPYYIDGKRLVFNNERQVMNSDT